MVGPSVGGEAQSTHPAGGRSTSRPVRYISPTDVDTKPVPSDETNNEIISAAVARFVEPLTDHSQAQRERERDGKTDLLPLLVRLRLSCEPQSAASVSARIHLFLCRERKH